MTNTHHIKNAAALKTIRNELCRLIDEFNNLDISGTQGPQGEQGPQGIPGEPGEDGVGTPTYYSSTGIYFPSSYLSPINPPLLPEENSLLFEGFTDALALWEYSGGWVSKITFSLPPINTPDYVKDIDLLSGATFTDKLNTAITYLNEGGILDLTNQGDKIITSTIIFSKPITVYWPASEITYTGAAGTDMFSFTSSQINFIGQGRTPKAGVSITTTKFIMDSGRYHIYSRGNGLIELSKFDCFGIKSLDVEDYPSANLSGSGGLYFEKADPGTTSGGNNITGLFISDVYVESTYAHGVYIDTPILSKLKNVRTSNVRGHGFYMNGGTSTVFESCFAASGYQAGFCIQSAAYCTLLGCAAETHGVGYWLRSVQGISIFSTGGESNKNVGSAINPVELETLAGDNVTPVSIVDISGDYLSDFRGTTWLITGGRGISLFSPYSTNIDQEYGFGTTNTSRHFKVRGNTRGFTVINPRISINSGSPVNYRFDWEFDDLGGDTPSDCVIYYDPADGTITPLIDSYFSNVNSAGTSTYIKSDTDDVIFIAGKQVFMSNDFDASISMEIGSGSGTEAPTKILLA